MRPLIHALLLSLVAAAAHAGAGIGDLLVTPTRIVLDRQTRTAEFMAQLLAARRRFESSRHSQLPFRDLAETNGVQSNP